MKNVCLVASCLFLGMFASCTPQPKPQTEPVEQKQTSETDVNVNVKVQVATQAQSQPTDAQKSEVSVSNPTILVIPAGTKNLQESLDYLKENSLAVAASQAINNTLANKQFNVITPEGSANTNNVINLQNDLAEQDEDLSYIASLSLGADIYIKYSTDIHRGQILTNLSAYEATSGRLIGTQSSTVNDNGTNMNELVASAVHKALPILLKKIQSFWKEESRYGIAYKVIFKFVDDFEDMDAAHNKATILLKENFKKTKLNAMTAETADVTIYAKPGTMDDAYSVFAAIQKALGSDFQVKKNNLVQRLLILEVSPVSEPTP